MMHGHVNVKFVNQILSYHLPMTILQIIEFKK